MQRLIVLSILVSGALGQIIVGGKCNYANINGFVTDINITQMLGTWNEIARIDNEWEKGECSSVTIDGIYDGNGALSGVNASFLEVNGTDKTYFNVAVQPVPVVDGLFTINLSGLDGSFVVQSTNYTDYAIVYACYQITTANETLNMTDTKIVMAWQYHRKATLSTSEQASVQELVNLNPDLNGTSWTFVSHTKKACGNAGVSLAVPHILIFLATLFISKEFV